MRGITSVSAEALFMELVNMALVATWIMLAVIAGCVVVVGVIMAIWNHRRLKRGYVPELEYEEAEQ